MAKRTRYKFQAANFLSDSLTKVASYTLTKNNILEDGNQFIKLTTAAHLVLTLPAADLDLKGIMVRVFNSVAANVTVSGGFGGGGANYDYARLVAYTTTDFWCDGSYWYAQGVALSATVSS